MSWENWTSTWPASRGGSNNERWNNNQWREAKEWQICSTADNKHGYSDADYLQGWCNADNEHDSEQAYKNAECWQVRHLKPRPEVELVTKPCFNKENLRDWRSLWAASITAAMAPHVARLEREFDFLKQKIAHDDSIASQSVALVNDRASRASKLNTDDAKKIVIVCEHNHGYGEFIPPILINDMKMETVWDWTTVLSSFNLRNAATLTTAALAMSPALQCSHRCGKNKSGNRFMQSHLAVVCRECSRG